MKKGMKTAAAILGVVLVTGVSACKHGGSHGGHAAKLKEHVNDSLKKVGASDEQKVKINGVMDQIAADGRLLRTSSRGVKTEFVGRILQDAPDREWLHTTVDEKGRELTAFAHRTIDRLIEISAVLTPGQRSELKNSFQASHGAKE